MDNTKTKPNFMDKKKYTVIKKKNDFADFQNEKLWDDVKSLIISDESYLWVNNGYKPKVTIKVFHTKKNIYLNFNVFEKKTTIKYTEFGGDIWKDSCVEFFINPFPHLSKEYFNIEINAMGVPLIGVRKYGEKPYYFKEEEVKDWEIIPSIKEAINGEHGNDFWSLHLKIPKTFFENHYEEKSDIKNGIANFYKCGDETEFEHYGAWNRIENPKPNFHLPHYFGELNFASKLSESK